MCFLQLQLIDDILEEYDAKLEQENARKREEERRGRGASSTESTDEFSSQTRMTPTTEDITSSSLFASDIPLETTLKPNLPLTRFGTQSTWQSKQSLLIPKNACGIRTKLMTQRSPTNASKVFVRISDCAQMVAPTPAPIRVRIRQGSITEMDPDEGVKSVEKTKSNSSTLKSEALSGSRLEDPFSDLPSDLLPGLYELPNLGFNEGASNMNSDSKELSGNKTPSISKVVYEKNIHTYSKSPDRSAKNTERYSSNLPPRSEAVSGSSNIKIEHVDASLADSLDTDGETQKLGIEDDDGSYVVIVVRILVYH